MAQDTKSYITDEQPVYDLFLDVAKSIISSLDEKQVITAIMHHIEIFFKPDNWSLYKVDPEKNQLYFVIAKGVDINKLKDIRIDVGSGIAGHVVKHRQSILVKDAQKDERFNQSIDQITGFKTHSIIAVPISFQKEVIGVIQLINTENTHVYMERDIKLLQAIGELAGIAMANADAYQEMSKVANHDALTGLYNRNYLEKFLSSLHPANSTNAEYTVAALIDINDFKIINDTYGHHVGDLVLMQLGKLLQSVCQENDYAFRLGGDEFLIIKLHLCKENLISIERELEKRLSICSQQLAPARGISFGIISGPISNLYNIILEADKLMYKRKHSCKSNHQV